MASEKIDFGDLLKLRRRKAGLTLAQFSKLLGYHVNSICGWEKDIKDWKKLPYERLEKMACILKCHVDDLKNDF